MKKIIFLVDMNAFYISCEMSRNSKLKGIPAANYEARKYNVKTAMMINEAKKLCPDIIFVPPDHDFYKERLTKVMEF